MPNSSSNKSVPRQRATAIVIRDEKILLVRDRTRTSFSLPGGGIESGELNEETTLVATSISYLFQHGGKANNHHVFRIQADGDVDVIADAAVEEFTWWDRASELSIYPHVVRILEQFGEGN